MSEFIEASEETPPPLTEPGAKAAQREAKNIIINTTAIQLGIDVLRELYDCGNLVTSIKDEEMNMKGVRALLTNVIYSHNK